MKLVVLNLALEMRVHVPAKCILAGLKMSFQFLVGLKEAATSSAGKALTKFSRVLDEHEMILKYGQPHDILALLGRSASAVGVSASVALLQTIYPDSYLIFLLKPLQVPEIKALIFRKLGL